LTVARPDARSSLQLAPRRTRALLYIAEHPGASNREVAAAVGIRDQGQVSRVLRRLVDLGLAVNHNGAADRGGANAWHLTAHGLRAVADAAEARRRSSS
jgi:DNA-binding MarR family transcriptional regulator